MFCPQVQLITGFNFVSFLFQISSIVFYIIFIIQVVSFVHKTLGKHLHSLQNIWICYCTEISVAMSIFVTGGDNSRSNFRIPGHFWPLLSSSTDNNTDNNTRYSHANKWPGILKFSSTLTRLILPGIWRFCRESGDLVIVELGTLHKKSEVWPFFKNVTEKIGRIFQISGRTQSYT